MSVPVSSALDGRGRRPLGVHVDELDTGQLASFASEGGDNGPGHLAVVPAPAASRQPPDGRRLLAAASRRFEPVLGEDLA